jgi:hypothetical protein
MPNTRAIIDYAFEDDAKNMRDAFYAALQDKVLNHIETHKIEVAKNFFSKPEETIEVDTDTSGEQQ